MSTHRIGELILDIHASEGDPGGIENAATAFAHRVVEMCGECLEERYPGRLFFLRQLPVRWNVDAAELDDAGLIRGLAAQLADAISSRLSPGVSTHIAYEDFAVFENEAEWRAGFLASRVRGEDEAWFYASLRSESGTFFQFLERGGVEPILTRLASRDALAAVLRTVSVSDLASILRALGFEPASTTIAFTSLPATSPGPLHRLLQDLMRELPPQTSSEMAAILLFFEKRRQLGAAAAREQVAAIIAGIEDSPAAEPAMLEPPGPEVLHGDSKPPQEPMRLTPAAIETEYGGFFYLTSLVVELGLAESLWKVCLPEGLVLARLLAELLPPEDRADRAPAIIGGVPDPFAPFEVSWEQQKTVAAELVASLSAALPRRGLASLPETALFLDHRDETKILEVAPPGAATVLYAHVCEGRESALEGVESFLRIWPKSAPPVRALPALAAIDRQGRLRPSRDPMPDAEILNFSSHPPASSALLSQAAGSLLYLFAARAGWSPRRPDELVARLRTPARVTSPGETLEVLLPGDAIQIELRRAGLDIDPGWLAWLQKTVHLRFAVSEI